MDEQQEKEQVGEGKEDGEVAESNTHNLIGTAADQQH